MVTIRSVNDIIQNMIDLLRLSQPNLDTKPGTVARDLVIDAPSSQIALLYDEVAKVSSQQSLRLVVGSDLDKLAKNYGIFRKSAFASSGVALLTFSSLQGTININKGDLVIASNGFAFSILNGVSVNASQANFYKSVATKFSNDLQFVGITDQYAVEVTVQSTTVGIAGNIGKYSLTRTNIPGVSNITNTQSFGGGSNQEDDATFRNRILSVFSGSSIGTQLGYKNTALATTGVNDAFVVEPGDPLMTRDGSTVTSDSNGNLTVVSEGSGGKVDVVILGANLVENTDSFIYQDKSNKKDPTDKKNIHVLGQIAADINKTFNQKRISDIANEVLPSQPVDSILQVSGSSSGSNFQSKTIDSFGRIFGNYELLKDTGIYAGSPWGFDSFHWISNKISGFSEDKIKGKNNGQDTVTYSDVIEIPKIQQNISITNENSKVLNSNRSLIQLLHTPATNVTSVFNVNTGERYVITNQNPNGIGLVNTSGIIQISGNTLPSSSDVLQVDYSWIVTFDQYSDYDGRKYTNNLRNVSDSTDWGYSNLIRNEKINFSENVSNTFFSGNTKLPISSIISVNLFSEASGTVQEVLSGNFAGRLSVSISNLPSITTSIDHIYFKHTNDELYITAQNNGSFTSVAAIVGINIEYSTTIILPNDTKATVGDKVLIIMDSTDVYNITNSTGSFSNNQITIPFININSLTPATNINLSANYIANIQDFFNSNITSLPASRIGGGYSLLNSNGFNNINFANNNRREFQAIQLNLSSQFYVELNLSSLDVSLSQSDIINVIRLSDNKELWNLDNIGSISVNISNNNYQLILNNYNTPSVGDRVLIIYSANDIKRFQPFSFTNEIIEKDFDKLNYDSITNNFIVNIHKFIAETNINFEILEPETNIVLASGNDGYVTVLAPESKAIFGSATTNFTNIVDGYGKVLDTLSKKIRILNASNRNNNNIYDIQSNNDINSIIIGNDLSKIKRNQISIIRILDGQELWGDGGTIDIINNQLLFKKTSKADINDDVLILFYSYNNLKQCPTRIAITTSDQVISTGTISFNGTTITKANDIVFTATNNGLKQNLIEAFKVASGLNSNSVIPSNTKLVKIAKLEKVSTATITSSEVLTVLATYDISNTTIQDNTYFINSFSIDASLGNFDFILPNTIINSNISPKIGDRLRVTFYYITSNDLENISFTRNGTLYTNKYFVFLNKIYVSSGFTASKSTNITLTTFNQPITGSRYKVFYDYTAPKQNERIIIKYNNNNLISDTTLNIEASRPINADVLVREAKKVLVDVIMNVVVSSQSTNSSTLILQNLKDALISAINSTSLGTTLDSSSLISTAFSINGISGARIQYFNVNGKTGQVLSISAHNDQYLVANTITINQVAN